MTPTILGADYATRIRYRLGVTDSHLATAEIDEVLPEKEALIKTLVPTWAAILAAAGDPKIYLQSACVCLIASCLCPLLKAKYPLREQGPGGSFETTINWDKRGLELEGDFNALLSKVKSPTIYSPFIIHNQG